MPRRLATGLIGLSLLCLIAAAGSASAQWNTVCKNNVCQLYQEVKDSKGSILARLYFQKADTKQKDSPVVAIANLPLGLFIPAGVGVNVDKSAKFAAQLLECNQGQGCRAAFDLKPELLKDVKGGKKLNVEILEAKSRKKISFHFDLKDFSAAYDKFVAKKE